MIRFSNDSWGNSNNEKVKNKKPLAKMTVYKIQTYLHHHNQRHLFHPNQTLRNQWTPELIPKLTPLQLQVRTILGTAQFWNGSELIKKVLLAVTKELIWFMFPRTGIWPSECHIFVPLSGIHTARFWFFKTHNMFPKVPKNARFRPLLPGFHVFFRKTWK